MKTINFCQKKTCNEKQGLNSWKTNFMAFLSQFFAFAEILGMYLDINFKTVIYASINNQNQWVEKLSIWNFGSPVFACYCMLLHDIACYGMSCKNGSRFCMLLQVTTNCSIEYLAILCKNGSHFCRILFHNL